jgi:serine O-acetyltransferase
MSDDPIWQAICSEAKRDAADEPLLASFLHVTILNHDSLEASLAFHLANKLSSPTLQTISLMEMFSAAFGEEGLQEAVRRDLQAVRERDAACRGYSAPLLYFKGFHALQAYRVAHWLWEQDREALALMLQSQISEVFAVDIHPAACIGHGILIDHATGIVIGETAVVGNNVSLLHEVTLGGTGKEQGDRHPKIGDGVLISAGAKILGNIHIGDSAKVGAGSVVLKAVEPHCTVAGVPAKVVGHPNCETPALEMDHRLNDAHTSSEL